MGKVIIMDHPLIEHKISLIRNKKTGTRDFRQIISEIAMLECYESTRDLQLEDVEIETPVAKTTGKKLAGKNTHHIIEATFKGLARALAKACEIDERFKDEIPSTKGSL